MGKSLSDKLRNGAVGLGLAGILGLSGCLQMMGAALKANKYKTHDPHAAEAYGDALIGAGNAQDSRSEQNVIINNPGNNQQQPANRTGRTEGRIEYDDGGVYEGQILDGKHSGRGVYMFKDGGVYEGEFFNDNYHGKGIFRYKSGDVYEGEFFNGKFQGKGIYRYKNGNVYEGEFFNSVRQGKGILRYKNGDVYEGELKDDKFEGYGVYTNKDGSKFEGYWSNNLLKTKQEKE